jgi:hypothetical protein
MRFLYYPPLLLARAVAFSPDGRIECSLQIAGMMVFNAYLEKNRVNFQRQESGYMIKDDPDSKHT